MTFKEKLERNRGCLKEPAIIGKAYGCPYDYGYEGHDDGLCKGNWVGGEGMCRACWDREIPLTPEEQERHDLEINAEIIRGYCGNLACGDCPANDVCRDYPGMWSDGWTKKTSAAKQRAVLDAFEAALPPEEEGVPTVRLPETVTVKIGPEASKPDEPWHLTPELRQQAHDAVNHPAHYTAGGIECIDAITAALECHGNPVAAFLTGQVLKYMWRWPMKGGREDLRKARWYLDRLLDEGDPDA